jgi:FixJ family two-component response regulator
MATVAILNSSEDTVTMLRAVFEHAGFQTVGGHVPEIREGRLDFIRFLETHDPAALVYDVSIPYAENWNFLRLLRDTEHMRNRVLVVTTTNKRALDSMVGPTDAIEIVGKPYEPDTLLDAVRRGLKSVA